MAENSMLKLCRLCLMDRYQSCNIFYDRSVSGRIVYEALNFVYNLDIYRDDGLPSHICRPCFWKLKEFEMYKMNVHCAKSELLELRRKELKEAMEGNPFVDTSRNGEKNRSQDANKTVEEDNVLKKEVNGGCNGSEDTLEVEKQSEHLEFVESHAGLLKSNPNYSRKNVRTYDENGSSIMLHVSAFPACLHEEVMLSDEDHKPILENSVDSKISDADLHSVGRNAVQEVNEGFIISNPRSIPHMPESAEGNNSLKTSKVGNSAHDKGVICEVCDKRLSSTCKLRRHMTIHYDKKPYSCNICGMKFKRQDTRKRHQRRHRETSVQSNVLQNWWKVV